MTTGQSEKDNNNLYTAYNMLLSFTGSFILYEPQQGCINDLVEQNMFESLPLESDNPQFILGASYLRKINTEGSLDYEEIINDHLELFGGKGRASAPPWGSVYMSKDHTMNDKSSTEVRKIYHAYGWRSSIEGKVPDDHLGIELQFINLLLGKYPELEDEVCRKEIRTDLVKFIDKYISPWINDWNRRMQEHSVSNFYKGIGYLTVACIEDVYSLMKRT
ncbi:MAG: molecular chaperone TorD family protein [Bacteroidales bacterium]|nr:molecular chaperone TorD family protein [Bacteroidales bacterium]